MKRLFGHVRVNKRAFSYNGSKSLEDEKNCFLNSFNLCKKSGDDTTNIETYFQTVFDICISDKFLHKDQSFQDTLV